MRAPDKDIGRIAHMLEMAQNLRKARDEYGYDGFRFLKNILKSRSRATETYFEKHRINGAKCVSLQIEAAQCPLSYFFDKTNSI